ncbi:hypothetical protein M405DRAFT_828507 [Rhizopogon salebrosus TDB-379]|nr:hypothetical protein M405DRAFT_828507 [Rhizopogon salebrosus TDB-379]
MRTSSDKGPTLQEHFPHEVSILPDWTPFRALYFNLVPTLTTLATATGSTLAITPRRPCHIRHRAGSYLFQPEGRLGCG